MWLIGSLGAHLTEIRNYGKDNSMIILRNIIIIAILSLGINRQVDAQLCCTTGSASASSLEVGVTPENSLRLSLGHEYNELSGTFEGSKRTNSNIVGSGSVQAYTLQAHYGMTRRWGVTLSVPFVKSSRTFSGRNTFRASGIGDLSFLLKYSLKPLNIATSTEIAIGSGFKMANGSDNAVDDGTALNFNLQPGTGAWDFMLWGYFYKTYLPSGWSGTLSALIRIPGTNSDGLQYGNEIIYSVVVNRKTTEFTQLSLRFKGRTSSQVTIDDFENPNTGGTITFIAPSFVWNPVRLFSIEAGIDIPAFYSVSGTQQALDFRSFINASFYFDL